MEDNTYNETVKSDPMEWEEKRNEFVYMVTSKGHEGGYVNHPDDPGGETNFGISKKEYPHLDIRNLDREDAMDIYKRDYLPSAETNYGKNEFALKMTDIGINAGPQTATEIIQKSLNEFGMDLDEDGKMGVATRSAFRDVISIPENRKKLMDLVIQNQKRLYAGEKFNTKTIDKKKVEAFGGGWKVRAGYRGV